MRRLVGEAGTSRRAAALLLLALLVSSAVLVIAHLAHVVTNQPDDWYWDLRNDRSYAEVLQYLMYVWSAVLLVVAFVRRRAPVLLAWCVVALYLMLDDLNGLHEHFGLTLARELGWVERWGQNTAGSVGEVVYMAAVALVLLVLVLVTHRLSGPPARRVSVRLGALFVVLAVVGVGFDVVHSVVSVTPGRLEMLFAILEDGGEMVVLSIIAAFCLHLAAGPAVPHGAPLSDEPAPSGGP